MSRAEELAKEIETRYRRGYETQEQANHRWLSSCKEAASELRRLAQVEAEHDALLKAISDAEPVAWRDPTNTDAGQSVTFSNNMAVKWPHIYSQSLYTLNGIKKP